jgi:cold shock CspA family protein
LKIRIDRHVSVGFGLKGFKTVATGTEKSPNSKRRFGLIRPDLGGEDIFVHSSEVPHSGLSSQRNSQKVNIMDDQGMPSARNLHICGESMIVGKRVASDLKDSLMLTPKGQNTAMNRNPITSEALQSVVAKAVRESDAQCEAFVGIIVERIDPKSNGGVNWSLKGVKYGEADRAKCDIAISGIVEQLQQEFVISDEPKWRSRCAGYRALRPMASTAVLKSERWQPSDRAELKHFAQKAHLVFVGEFKLALHLLNDRSHDRAALITIRLSKFNSL